MRFALRANDRRVHDLVVALDVDDVPVAATWRAVGAAAENLGLSRPSYHTVRRIVRAERLRRRRAATVRRATREAAVAFTSPRVADFRFALERLADARRDERLVLLQHKPPRAGGGATEG